MEDPGGADADRDTATGIVQGSASNAKPWWRNRWVIVGAVVALVIIAIASNGSSGGSANYPSWLCPKVITDLDNAQFYISDNDGSDLWDSANNVVNVIQGATDSIQLSGTPLANDSLALESDANAMSNGDPNNAQTDYNAVMHDCGK
jgi:hypothetical protein